MTTWADAGLLVLRLAITVIMFYHGTQKLFGWWHGQGLAEAAEFFARQGFRPPRLMALVAAFTETAGSLLLGSGLALVLGTAMLTGVLTNVVAIHVRNGMNVRKFGIEFELSLLAGTVAIGLTDGGSWTLDALLGVPRISWLGPAAVALGLLGGLAVVATRSRESAAANEAPAH
ncbi:DoxX family protein [Amycolatopsis sp. WQ 127309]|uniref:DoxX family protein n=1 Tax=Amycolatopsis sp. WQ 127309 TaxID=2932773 RepID=UPI001FF48876|nr:DoxX family protein [Amycolatopsis sp. WQ 127309]UOZ03434.1 DoxX family protein [Amycolatopsis sp. WQ 127309]